MRSLPFARGLVSKAVEEVCRAVRSVISEIKFIFGSQVVNRFHSDAGKEFLGVGMMEMLKELNITQTKTAGHDPKANGRAERFVGIIKQHATAYLIHGQMSIKYWY